ncbi:MAG: hypothetical protein KAJ40_08840, partial [Alphaproteobacteria bacterium]|nr:hypothetical protein [Alphaproteobacteria bacterium]
HHPCRDGQMCQILHKLRLNEPRPSGTPDGGYQDHQSKNVVHISNVLLVISRVPFLLAICMSHIIYHHQI